MELIFICSIIGQDITDRDGSTPSCLEELCREGQRIRSIHLTNAVEQKLPEKAAQHISKYNSKSFGFVLADALGTPMPELASSCQDALSETLREGCNELKKQEDKDPLLIVPLHPVLFHQQNSGFVSPYLTFDALSTIKQHDLSVTWVVSIHDDIYDIYRRTLKSYKLHYPLFCRAEEKGRNPIQDVNEQMFMLGWRDRELAASKAMAATLGAKHFLFHQKGSRDSLWKIIGENIPSAYFSHPISHPRRDMRRIPLKNGISPERARGEEFMNLCQAFANRLSTYIPIIEPTAIDELRIQMDQLGIDSEQSLKDKDCGYILPPLSKRWLRGSGDRFDNNQLADISDRSPYLPVSSETFQSFQHNENNSLQPIESALNLLEEEIKRQIAVRDYTLAEECNLVIAYRPFSKPDEAMPSGGVSNEIDVILKKVKLGKECCQPALLVVHSLRDEQERRRKQFDITWNDQYNNRISGKADDVDTLREKMRYLIENAPYLFVFGDEYTEYLSRLSRDLTQAITSVSVSISPPESESREALERGAYLRGTDSIQNFVSEMLDSSIVEPDLFRSIRQLGAEYVEFWDIEEASDEFCKRVESIIHRTQETK